VYLFHKIPGETGKISKKRHGAGGTTLKWPRIPAGLMICGDFFLSDEFGDELGNR